MKKSIITLSVVASIISLIFVLKYFFGAELFAELIMYQKIGNKFIYDKMEYLKNSSDWSTVLVLTGMAVLYGILHAIGPGHGKSIVANYFLKKQTKDRSAMIVSVTTSFTHTGSAILVAYLFKTIFSHINIFARMQVMDQVSILSGIAILTIGVILLIYRLINPNSLNHDHGHDHSSHKGKSSRLDAIGIGIVSGIAPCPLAMSIMLLAISAGIAYIGVLTVLGMSFGMLIVLFLVAFLAISAREKTLKLLDNDFQHKAHFVLGYMQSILFILIGLFMIRAF